MVSDHGGRGRSEFAEECMRILMTYLARIHLSPS